RLPIRARIGLSIQRDRISRRGERIRARFDSWHWKGTEGARFFSSQLASPAQWMVALLGLCLYPALARSGRLGSGPSAVRRSELCGGPGSHSIQVERPSAQARSGGSGAGLSGFLRRLRRVVSDGRAQARRLCGRDGALQAATSSFSRKRSFGSRSSKSEDVLSSRLSMDSMRSAQQHAGGGGGGRRGFLQRKGGDASRWRPSIARIASGQHLTDMAASESSRSSINAGKRLEILSYNGFQSVDCLQHEMTAAGYEAVHQVVTDTHLLQFGALIGEASAELALSQAGSPGAVGPEPDSLFGTFDRRDAYRQGWELVVEEHQPGLHYWAWRRHLRKGLFMYKSKTVYERATTAQITGFTYDTDFRRTWDETVACQLAVPPPHDAAAPAAAGAAAPSGGAGGMSLAEADAKAAVGRSAFMYARTKFPPPMASREYTYVRRCWAKPDDGGCYCVSRACAHPSPPPAGGRTVRVTDFISGYVIRSSKGVFDAASPAVEVVNVYFEDPCVPSGIVNMGIRRALWPMVQKAEAAFRDYLLTRVHGGLEQPPPELAVALDSLGAAMGMNGVQAAARAAAAAADADAASCIGGLLPALGRRCCSPYMLLYGGYTALWRGGRGALLSALSCLMSLWCNATGLFCASLVLGRRALDGGLAAGAALRTALQPVRGRSQQSKGGIARAGLPAVLAGMLWPWESVLHTLRGAGRGSRSNAAGLERSASGGSAGGDRLSSHPLPGANAPPAQRRVTCAPGGSNSGGGSADGAASPRGPRRARGGFMRRCAFLVAKVAGAGLLLGRATRAETDAADQEQRVYAPARVTAAPPQQQERAAARVPVRRAVVGQRDSLAKAW
ncbi:hypothetical protein TSOC_009556, partial [Tetrabaena socialis]